MSPKIVNAILWLFILNLGIVFGAGLYEARIELPQWLVRLPDGTYQWDAAAVRQADSGLRFWVFFSTIPLTLLTLLNLVLAWRAKGALRAWWLTAALAALAERISTFSYFIPTMIALMQNEALAGAEAADLASRWENLNYFRHLLGLVAWVAALKTFKQYGRKELSKYEKIRGSLSS